MFNRWIKPLLNIYSLLFYLYIIYPYQYGTIKKYKGGKNMLEFNLEPFKKLPKEEIFNLCANIVNGSRFEELHFSKGHLFFEDGNIDIGTCQFYIDIYNGKAKLKDPSLKDHEENLTFLMLFSLMTLLPDTYRAMLCYIGGYGGFVNIDDGREIDVEYQSNIYDVSSPEDVTIFKTALERLGIL